MRCHSLAGSDVVKSNELGFSEGLLCRHLGKAKGESSYITRSKGRRMDLPKPEALRMAICDINVRPRSLTRSLGGGINYVKRRKERAKQSEEGRNLV